MVRSSIQSKWASRKAGEDLRMADLLPVLKDPILFEKNLNSIVKASYESSLRLFPDLHDVFLPSEEDQLQLRSQDPLSIYLNEIKSLGASDREEEYVLARAMEIARKTLEKEVHSLPLFDNARGESNLGELDTMVQDALEQWSDKPPKRIGLTASEFQKRIGRIRQRLEEIQHAKSLLVMKNLHLVPNFARRYRNLGVPYQDLIQEGNASLLRAAEKFDWRREVRFSSYAQWWIQQAILKCLYCQSRTVRLPVYLNQKMKKIREANRESLGETGTDLTAEEISDSLQEPVNRIRRALNADVSTVSLEREYDSGEEYSLKDLLVDPHDLEIEDKPVGPDLKQRIAEILQTLPEKERKILILRFGLNGEKGCTLEEVSKIFHVSRERIRQIQVQALQKLVGPAKKHSLKSFLN